MADCALIERFRDQESWQPHHPHTILIRNSGRHPIRSVTVTVPGLDGGIETESRELFYWVGDVPPDTTRTGPLDCDLHYHEAAPLMLGLSFELSRKRWLRQVDRRLRRRRQWPFWIVHGAYRLRERYGHPEVEPAGQAE
ncbi:hypothetical protein ACWCPS_36090 [Streptomyces mauvecolor]